MDDFILYPHQQRASETLLAGKNVILQAPTGSGKTFAALLPWINAKDRNRDFPRKCIYTVPMRVLANQFLADFAHLNPSIQTGENSGDLFYESDLIFTTIDQALSRFLNYPYGVSKRKANLNAAAVIGSYLVFDEFHLLDPKSTLPTTLAMLKLLNGITPFMLMTATFSSTMLGELAQQLNAEVIPGTPAEAKAFLTLTSEDKTRRYHTSMEPLTAQLILDAHRHRSLVICNTVDRARALFDDLRRLSPHTEIILLHSRFLPEDRQRAQARLQQAFGKNADRTAGSVIAVATQAIEVGVDITSEALHTELAPANAIIQRAGRCARYPGNIGDVTLYRYSLDKGEVIDLTERVNPYAGQAETMRQTWEAFVVRSGDRFTFADEQAILSQVHTDADRTILDNLSINGNQHQSNMFALMAGHEYQANPSALIRDVFQVRITISDDPNSLLASPFDAPAFGLHPGTLKKYAAAWLQDTGERPFTLKTLVVLEKDKDDSETYKRTEYKWEPVQTVDSIIGAALIVLHPSLVRYDPERGLILGEASEPAGWQASVPAQEQRREGNNPYTYRLETYERHIHLVYDAAFGAQGVWAEMADLAGRLERRFGWAQGDVRKATELAVLLHDVGKLSKGWQKWVRDYQAKLTDREPTQPGEAYAHTDSETEEHKRIEKSMPRRPTHAVESALASQRILRAFWGDSPIRFAIYSAISRHHAPFALMGQSFALTPSAAKHIETTINLALVSGLDHNWLTQVLELLSSNLAVQGEEKNFKDALTTYIAEPKDEEKALSAYLAYTLISRVLRFADGRGTEAGTKNPQFWR